jgi:hypothetical protein
MSSASLSSAMSKPPSDVIKLTRAGPGQPGACFLSQHQTGHYSELV